MHPFHSSNNQQVVTTSVAKNEHKKRLIQNMKKERTTEKIKARINEIDCASYFPTLITILDSEKVR